MYKIRNIGTNSVNILAGSGSLIDGTSTITISINIYITLQSDGSNWWKV